MIMKKYSHDYTKPSQAESLLYNATRLMAKECYYEARECINEARQLLWEYMARDNVDNMYEDDEIADCCGWVQASDVVKLINQKEG